MVIRKEVQEILSQLDKTTPLIKELKQIPRTGFEVRIKKFKLDLPVQSIYDHILSVAANVDCFILMRNFKEERQKLDTRKLASFIAFHDLAETQIGDIPEFLSEELAEFNEKYKVDKKTKLEQEKLANDKILEIVPPRIKKSFEEVSSLTAEESDPQSIHGKFIWFVDKTESIIAVWRYIFNHKEKIDIEVFIEATAGFFDNPKVLKNYSYSSETENFIKYMQNRENAKNYYEIGSATFPDKKIEKLIERPFEHTLKL